VITPSSLGLLPAETEVLVLGADLAGAVAASRLARAGRRVVVLDRREPGQLGDGAGDAAEAPADLFTDPRWPAALRQDALASGGALAAAVKQARTAPALVEPHLAEATALGARVFLGVAARALEAAPGGAPGRWLVKIDVPGLGRERFDAPAMFLAADAVVLAGGAWAGELLAAAHQHGVPLSPLLAVSRTAIMGESAAAAVVDHLGRVFRGEGADPPGGTAARAGGDPAVHAGLVVVGDAAVPTALRPLPAVAVVALAARAAEALIAAGPAAAGGRPPVPLAAPAAPGTVGLRFTETMRGFFSTQVTDADYARGAALGREDGSTMAFVVSLIADDLATLVDAPEHRARILGTVVAPALSARPMMVTEGEFDLFGDPAPAQAGERAALVDPVGLHPRRERHMRYRMPVRSAEGKRFFLSGYKVIRDDPGFDVWADTTTLLVTVHAGDDAAAPVLGRGVLRILMDDLRQQVRTVVVTGTSSTRRKLRARLAFARVFGGTLFDAYLGEEHLLPGLGARRGPARVALAGAAKLLAGVIVAGLALWPWRPALLRQEPPIAADPADPAQAGPNEPSGEVGRDLPAAVAALGLLPQQLRGLDLRAPQVRVERLDFRAGWRDDNIVTDHGGLADLPVRPPDIPKLTDLPLRRAYLNLARVRDGAGQVVGVGSQVETAAWDSRPWRHVINADTTWSLVFPGRGLLFLSQKEGGADIAATSARARSSGQTWRGHNRFNHTLGPLPDGRGIVHGGSGQFAGAVGAFREWNSLFEVPPQGIIHGATEFELHLLRAPRAADADARVRGRVPAAVAALGLPPAALERLHPARPWRVVVRRFRVDLPDDAVYRTHGPAGQGPVVPASLGPLADPALQAVTVLMARLRDERGDVVGQAGAARLDGPAGPARGGGQLPGAAQWTLLLPGEGALFVMLPEDQLPAMAPGPAGDGVQFFGGARGLVVGGTGLYADAAGVLGERWLPATDATDGGGTLALTLQLVNDR
jgi:choline dehydrogenase-like flavoprotein